MQFESMNNAIVQCFVDETSFKLAQMMRTIDHVHRRMRPAGVCYVFRLSSIDSV